MNRIVVTTAVALFSCIGCRGQHTRVPAESRVVIDRLALPTDSATCCFLVPACSRVPEPKSDSFVVPWYSRELLALKEPVLHRDTSGKLIYRFTWLRTFHHPVAVRIERTEDAVVLFWKLCDGMGGYAPGKLTVDKHKILDTKTWDEFLKKLKAIDFRHLENSSDISGNDGSQWVLEGKSGNQYHAVERWTPGPEGVYYQCCDYLLGLTDLKIKANKY